MIKSLSLLIAGAIVGGLIVCVTINARGDAGASGWGSPRFLQRLGGSAVADSRAGEAPSVAEALEIYRAAAAESDVAALRMELENQARAPSSATRIARIDAALARLSDLAPAEAAALARSLGLDPVFVASAYLNFATVDPDRAVSELGLIEGKSVRSDVALTLLDVFGDSTDGIDRVSVGLPESERSSVRIEWIARRAEKEPFAAIRDAQALSRETERRDALERIGRSWAAQDPRGALAEAARLPDDVQNAFRAGVFDEWARLDAADFLAWLGTTTSPPSDYFLAERAVTGIIDPDLILDVADDMPEPVGRRLKANALGVLAERNPDAAMARVTAMPPGDERESMLASVVSGLSRRDPDAALEWARTFGSPPREVLSRIVQSIAQTHPERALEMMDDPPEGFDPNLTASWVASALAANPDHAESLAGRLIAKRDVEAAGTLRNLVGPWIREEPERALEWILANEARLGGPVIGAAAQAMARIDAAAAASYVQRVSADSRSVWINQVAASYGAADMSAALAWVDEFRDDEVYSSALRQIVSAAAEGNPRAAAQVLAQSRPEVMRGAATRVAQAYARIDPHEAIRWAETLRDASARDEALAAAIPLIVGNDPNLAEALLDSVTSESTRRQLEERLRALNP